MLTLHPGSKTKRRVTTREEVSASGGGDIAGTPLLFMAVVS
jgi:hypothetical protein